MKVGITYPATEFVTRQTPGRLGRWGEHSFTDSYRTRMVDAWVVYEDLPFPQSMTCDSARTVFVTGAPASIRRYDPRFLSQFAAVITPQEGLEHPNIVYSQPAIPWWIGINISNQPGKSVAGVTLGYDEFKAQRSLCKTKLVSVICSSKAVTEGHRARVRLVGSLRKEFGSRIDFFGHGSNPVKDKWDAIAPYRYHIVIENNRTPHYWTEKLADAYLGLALPIYCGAPNIGEYFPPGSYCEIDRYSPDRAVQQIAEILDSDPYESRLQEILSARDLVTDRYNLFPMLVDVLQGMPEGERRTVRLRPHRDFVDPLRHRLRRSAKRFVFGAGMLSG